MWWDGCLQVSCPSAFLHSVCHRELLPRTEGKESGEPVAWASPSIHGSSQNLIRCPLPRWNLADAAKRFNTFGSEGNGKSLQALFGSVHCIHIHRSLRAVLCAARSEIPSPPKHVGRHTTFQLTRHFPSFANSFPFHRNPQPYWRASFVGTSSLNSS